MFYDTGDLRDGEIVLQLKETREAQPEKRWLPAYYFDICLPDGTKAGNCSLRVGHNEKTRIGGNIGYGVYPAERFLYNFTFYNFFSEESGELNDMCFLVATPDPV